MQAFRNIKVKIAHDQSFSMPNFGPFDKKIVLPTFDNTLNTKMLDVSNGYSAFTCSWKHGASAGTIEFNAPAKKEFKNLHRNDIVTLIFKNKNGKKVLISTGLKSGNSLSLNVNEKETRFGYSLQFKEVSRFLSDHQIYYNPYMEGGNVQPFLRWIADIMLLGTKPTKDNFNATKEELLKQLADGDPAKLIKALIKRKLLGQGSKIAENFQGGFLMNDGSRLINWLDLTSIIDRTDPEPGLKSINPESNSSQAAQLIRDDPCIYAYNVRSPSSIQGRVWQKIVEYAAQPLWEIFTVSDLVGERPKQKLIYRPLPFWCQHYGWTLWDHLPKYEFSIDHVTGNSRFTWDDSEDFNFFIVDAQGSFFSGSDITAQHVLESIDYGNLNINLPLAEGRFIERFGFKVYSSKMNCFPLYNTEITGKVQESIAHAGLRLWDYNYLNSYYLKGMVNLIIPSDTINLPKIGNKLTCKENDFEAYITGVSIAGGPGKTMYASVQFTRGMKRSVHEYLVSDEVRKKLLAPWDYNQKLPDNWKDWI